MKTVSADGDDVPVISITVATEVAESGGADVAAPAVDGDPVVVVAKVVVVAVVVEAVVVGAVETTADLSVGRLSISTILALAHRKPNWDQLTLGNTFPPPSTSASNTTPERQTLW